MTTYLEPALEPYIWELEDEYQELSDMDLEDLYEQYLEQQQRKGEKHEQHY